MQCNFTKYFSSESYFLFFPHCGTKRKRTTNREKVCYQLMDWTLRILNGFCYSTQSAKRVKHFHYVEISFSHRISQDKRFHERNFDVVHIESLILQCRNYGNLLSQTFHKISVKLKNLVINHTNHTATVCKSTIKRDRVKKFVKLIHQ